MTIIIQRFALPCKPIDILVWFEHIILDVVTWEIKLYNLLLKHQRKALLIQISF